jgi:UDP-N-acetyl-2-amino-2-deoxyglucuronate dehydrogenase
MAEETRIAVIGGAAGIAATHLEAIAALPDARLVGLSDLSAERLAPRAAAVAVPAFADHRAMLAELRPDLAVICTPHPSHAALALDCFAAGAHVLVEKPIAVSVGEADTMIAAAEAAGRTLAVSFQQRFRPEVELARAMVVSGELGELVRVLCVEPWFRSATYYRSAGWRGSWAGEGGGVLMNQAPHTLDLLCHLAGRPASVWGVTRTLQHAIETEDTAHALLEFPGGAPGYLFVTTAETGAQYLEVVGDRASLRLSGSGLTVTRFEPAQRAFLRESPEMFAAPTSSVEELRPEPTGPVGHQAVYRDLLDALAAGRAPRCDGAAARESLELANALTLSSHLGRAVALPIDRPAYDALLAELRAGGASKGGARG